MSTSLKSSQTNIISGLGSYTYTCQSAGMHMASLKSSFGDGSTLVATIAQSGSATNSVTGSAPPTARRTLDLQTVFNCAVGDVITITLSSSAQIDNQPLTGVKTIVNVHLGMN